jgi:hypothetical protein
METDELLAVAEDAGFEERKEAALKSLVRSRDIQSLPSAHNIAVQAFKRNGYSCVLAGVKFNNAPDGDDYNPILAHVIPNSVHGKVGFALFTQLICGPISSSSRIH